MDRGTGILEAPETVEPGIHLDMPDEQYHALEYASKSKLWRLRNKPDNLSSVEEVRQWVNYPVEGKYALAFGRLFDDIMSNPDNPGLIREKYDEGPVNQKTGKGYGGDTKTFQAAQSESEKTLIVPEDFTLAANMVESLRHHPIAGPLVFGKGSWQVSMVWDDPASGVRCKGRVDRITEWVNPRERVRRVAHIDIKTARSVDKAIFDYDAKKLGYGLQAAHYLDGTQAVRPGNSHRDFVFVVVCKSELEAMPGRHEVIVCDYQAHHLETWLRVRDELLREWAEVERGTWKPRMDCVHELHNPYAIEHEYGDRAA